jgi:hypothetical protein
MADVITRFRLETTQYDSKLRDAAKGLKDYTRQASMAGNEFGKFTQKNVEAARALGSITPSANNAKDKVKELVGAFNEVARAYNALTKEQQQSDFGKALSQSLSQLSAQAKEAKRELYDIGDAVKNAGGGGIFSNMGDKMSGALQVFAGNMLTKAAGGVMSLGSELYGAVQQGIEMAKAGEGIRVAFERLGRGDILQGLREATHGTVTDLELMKAAVKFNDFKLPVEELGTMLAFAQQKAKDTGQSVDYMVDSIVTGLGRKSLMILDNLGLSATEVKEKMKETGDMTKAVGTIIREQMSKAGDYVETAADRAAQANVSLQNKMEELGRKFAPVEEASSSLWTSMKIGILDVIGGPLATLLNQLTEAGRLQNQIANFQGGGNGRQTHTERVLGMLKHYSGDKQGLYNRQVARYDELESGEWRNVNRLREELRGLRQRAKTSPGNVQPLIDEATRQMEAAERRAKAWQVMRANYKAGARAILSPQTNNNVGTGTDNPPIRTGSSSRKTAIVQETEKELTIQQQIAELEKEAYTASGERRAEIGAQIRLLDEELAKQKAIRDELHGIVQEEKKVEPLNLGSTSGLSAYIGELKKRQGAETIGSDKWTEAGNQLTAATDLNTIMSSALAGGLDGKQIEAITAPLRDALSSGLIDKNKLMEEVSYALSDINALLRERGIDPIVLDVKTNGIDNVKESVGELSKSTTSASSAMTTLGGAIGSLEDPSAKVAGIVMQAIGNVALGFSHALATPKDPWSWIAFAAAGTATMISTIAAIHSATGYANGGIVNREGGGFVPGNSYSGDQVRGLVDGVTPVGLNSGELVLNKAQTNNLATALSGTPGGGMNLTATLRGEDIELALQTRNRRTGRRPEYVYSK